MRNGNGNGNDKDDDKDNASASAPSGETSQTDKAVRRPENETQIDAQSKRELPGRVVPPLEYWGLWCVGPWIDRENPLRNVPGKGIFIRTPFLWNPYASKSVPLPSTR